MKLLLTLLLSTLGFAGLSKEKVFIIRKVVDVKLQSDTVYEFTKVTVMPKFNGGMPKFYNSVKSNLEYPEAAKKEGIRGRVFISFIVELDGKISNIKVLRGIGHGCDEAAINAIKKMSFLAPGYLNTKPVRTRLNMPIEFGI